jgi:hypothetical protein
LVLEKRDIEKTSKKAKVQIVYHAIEKLQAVTFIFFKKRRKIWNKSVYKEGKLCYNVSGGKREKSSFQKFP